MKRQYRSDEEKRRLIAEFDALPKMERGAWLKAQKLAQGWFRKMRQQFLQQDAAGEKPVVAMVRVSGVKSFREASRQEKSALVREYDRIRNQKERKLWREQHGLLSASDSALLTYYRYGGHGGRKRDKRLALAPSSTILAEYDALSKGDRGAWLQKRGLSRQKIYDIRHRNGSVPIDLKPIDAIPVAPGLSLDDAILALEVKRDHFNEFLENLKRLRAGSSR